MSKALGLMITALGHEAAAIRKKGGGTQVELRDGRLVGQSDGSWVYSFDLSDEPYLRDDTPVQVSVGKEEVSGVVISLQEGVLLVALETDLGPTVPLARLISNDSFLIDRLKQRLEKVGTGDPGFNSSMAEKALGQMPSSSGDAEPSPAALASGGINDDQIAAVKRSLGSDVTFVWGPPGTGKTSTLARIVEAHYRAGRSVLLVSNTNIAVDTALERVVERLESEPGFSQGLVIREGPIVKAELRQRFGEQVVLEAVVARLGEGLRQRCAEVQTQVAGMEPREQAILIMLQNLANQRKLKGIVAECEKAIHGARSEEAEWQSETRRLRNRASALNEKASEAERFGALKRFLLGLNPAKLKQEAVKAEGAAHWAEAQAAKSRAAVEAQEAQVLKVRPRLSEYENATAKYPHAENLEQELQLLRSGLAKIRAELTQLEGEKAALQAGILNKCKVLATTAYRTYLGKAKLRSFDTVVVDEASMLIPPLVYFAAGLARHAVTVAGDFRQLPPIVISEEPVAQEWLKRDVFEISAIPNAVELRRPLPKLVKLGIQYRMREPICAVVNELFYPDHPLRSDPSVRRGGAEFPLGKAPLLYIDTSAFRPWAAFRVGGYSRYNLFHALLLRNLVAHLAEEKFLPGGRETNTAVGVISPYAAQARLIQTLLDERLGQRAVGISATVHRFQGNEKSAIFLDLTDSLGVPLGRFLKASKTADEGARLVNVALSRAKHHLVVLGNLDYLKGEAPELGIVRRLVDRLQADGEGLDVSALLPLAEKDWIDGLDGALPATAALSPGTTGAFSEETFYPAFRADLAAARESVVILSPFATQRGTDRWLGTLRTAIAHGAQIRVITRPPGAQGGIGEDNVGGALRGLRDLGASVDLRGKMHEKIAILDSRILWHGSLNILSHRDTHESMLRIHDKAACELLLRYISSPLARNAEAPPPGQAENPPCPVCGRATVWNDGRFGVYFECEDKSCKGKVDAKRGRGKSVGASPGGGGANSPAGNPGTAGSPSRAGQPCPEAECGGRLSPRTGRFGPFLGCSNFPACRHTENGV